MPRALAGVLLLLALTACGDNAAPVAPVEALRLVVLEDGVYRLTGAALREAGLAVETLKADNVHLSAAGEAVPFLLDGDNLTFYGQRSRSRYTDEQVYILRAGEAGMTMAEEEAPPAGPMLDSVVRTVVYEENWDYASEARDAGVEEPWFWQAVPLQGELSLTLEVPGPAGGAGQLSVQLYGASHHPQEDPDHSLSLQLNQTGAQAISWEGQTAYSTTLALERGTLIDGENGLVLANVPEGYLDMMQLDWLRLDYAALPRAEQDRLAFQGAAGQVTLAGFSAAPLLLNVANPAAPTVLTGWKATADGAIVGLNEAARVAAVGPEGFLEPAAVAPLRSGGWRAAENGADLIIITTDELAPALEALVAARQEQGLRVALVPVAEIYDEFGAGMATPESINRFLTHAHSGWTAPAPGYVLLVGDATVDFRGYQAQRPEEPVSKPANAIPPFLVAVSYGGETVSDARLADVDGDLKPDLAIGRWPVDDADAVRKLAARTLAYEAGAAADRVLFASDASSPEFAVLADRLAADTGMPAAATVRLNGPASEQLVAEWNAGSWLVAYAGHGSLQLWGKDAIFSSDAISTLSPGSNAPIVLQLTCLSGLFAHPEITSLSERLLADEDGPVLTVAATSLTLSSQQEPFARAFLLALQEPGVLRIGDALQRAKQSLDVSTGALLEISDTFGLIGDPSALIVRP